MNYSEVIDFWFLKLTPEQWFGKSDEVDNTIKEKFLEVHNAAASNELSHWRAAPLGQLAEIIVLDQFSRNIYRDTPKAFAQDGQALALAQVAVDKGSDQRLELAKRMFLYLPYMHSESLQVHNEAFELFKTEGLEHTFDFEMKHRKIIERFGRYPHRNEILGRESTKEEIEFLKEPDSSF